MSGEIGWEYAVDNLGMGFDSNRFKVLDDYDISRTVDLLEAGAVDVVLADALTCNTWLKSGSQRTEKFKLVLENDRLNVCDNGFLARKGDEDLCDWLEKRLRLARETPEIALLESDILESLAGIVRRREI